MAHGKPRLHKAMPDIVSARRAQQEHDQEVCQAQRYQHIGQRKVELDWVKKKRLLPPDAQRELIEPAHPQRSIARQGDLIGLSRSPSYSQAQGESPATRTLMRLLDKP